MILTIFFNHLFFINKCGCTYLHSILILTITQGNLEHSLQC